MWHCSGFGHISGRRGMNAYVLYMRMCVYVFMCICVCVLYACLSTSRPLRNLGNLENAYNNNNHYKNNNNNNHKHYLKQMSHFTRKHVYFFSLLLEKIPDTKPPQTPRPLWKYAAAASALRWPKCMLALCW